MKYPRLALLCLSVLFVSVACTRDDSLEDIAEEKAAPRSADGNDAAIERVRAAVRAMSQPDATVDSVAAEMKGVVKVRTKSQALIHYDGYRATFVTPGDAVTQITFDLTEAKPSVRQMTDEFGTASEGSKGLLYGYASASTGAKIEILAEPVSMPADERSQIQRIIIRRSRRR